MPVVAAEATVALLGHRRSQTWNSPTSPTQALARFQASGSTPRPALSPSRREAPMRGRESCTRSPLTRPGDLRFPSRPAVTYLRSRSIPRAVSSYRLEGDLISLAAAPLPSPSIRAPTLFFPP